MNATYGGPLRARHPKVEKLTNVTYGGPIWQDIYMSKIINQKQPMVDPCVQDIQKPKKLLIRSDLWWTLAGKPSKRRKLMKVTSGKSSKFEKALHSLLLIVI